MLHLRRNSIQNPISNKPNQKRQKEKNKEMKKDNPMFYNNSTSIRPPLNLKEPLSLLRRHLLPDPVPNTNHGLHHITQV